MEKLLENQVVLITGAATGIGRSAALVCAREGARLFLVDIDGEKGEETAILTRELGGSVYFAQCDVAVEKEVEKVISDTVAAYGKLDCAFNNAGIEGEQGLTADCIEENWNRVIDINLKGVWLCMKHEIPHMIKQKCGSIVNCSSIAGKAGFTGIPAYVASKHGVIGLTKAAALEYARDGLRVNAVCPGVIQTPMIERFTHGEAQIRKQLIDGEPMGRIGQPCEVAEAVVWLCSKGSSFVTGHSLVIDGGWLSR